MLQRRIICFQVFLQTFWFVDPASICGGGRTEAEFASEGTVQEPFYQVGQTAQAANLLKIPLLEKDLVDDIAKVGLRPLISLFLLCDAVQGNILCR